MTKEEMQVQFDALKANYEASTGAVKTELKAEIDALKAKIDAMGNTASAASVDELKSQITALTAKLEATFTEEDRTLLNDTATRVKSIKQHQQNDKPTTFREALDNALNEGDNMAKLEKMVGNHKDRDKRFSLELKAVGDVSTANVTGGSRWGQVLRPGIVEAPIRRVHIRDLVPGGTIGQGTEFVFMRDNGGEGNPSPVAEGWTKAQMDMDLVETSVKIETIAGWMRVTRKAMNNVPGFLSYMQVRMPERLLRIEDAQLLQGNGVSPNLKGIMTAGNYTAATTVETLLIEQLIDGLAQLEDTNERYADGILLRPKEYFRFFKTKAGGSKEYDLPKNVVFEGGTLRISGIPVYQSTAVPNNKYIIGDWSEGAQLLTQEGIRLEFFEQDGTNVRENKITIRIEETVAFPVYGSDYFIVGDVGADSLTS